ncbi:MAG: ABC-type antimicrobial peptide transport system permease subunit, partial [Cyclobacteriaceae bacterium]
TETISALLIIFSIVSICFYLYNLLKNHLQKIKPNLGTFLAFGLDTKILFSLYRELLLSFIVKAIGLSLAISFGILLVFSLMTDTFDNYFALFDWKLLATVVILVGAFYMIFKWTIEAILRKTPGDLIYDR